MRCYNRRGFRLYLGRGIYTVHINKRNMSYMNNLFSEQSMSGTGWLVILVSFGLKNFGFEFTETEIMGMVTAIATVVGFAMAMWGQFRRGDLKWGLFRVQ